MNPTRYTEVSAQASERYQAVLTTFRGMLFAYLNESFSASRASELRSNAVDIGKMFFRSEQAIIEEELHRTALDALWTVEDQIGVQRSKEVSDTFSAFLTQHMDYLESELRAQLSRDVEMLVRRFREVALEKHLGAAARLDVGGVSRFHFRDRVGRLYPSQKFVRSVWRHSLVMVGAEFFALEAADRGYSEIEVVSQDKSSRWTGLKIGLSDASPEPSFSDVRDEVFHPQTQITLKVADVPA